MSCAHSPGYSLGKLGPVDLGPLVGEGPLQRRAGLLPPLCSLVDGGVGALDLDGRQSPHLGGLARLLVDELDPLLLVLLQQRTQLGRHGIPGRLVFGAPEFGSIAAVGGGFGFFVGSFFGGLALFPVAFGDRVVTRALVGGRSLLSLLLGGFAKIGHQRDGLGDVHGLGCRRPVLAVQVA